MKKLIYKGLAAIVLGVTLISCDKGFDELNEGPNGPAAETVDPNMLLTPTLKDGVFSAHLHQRIHNLYVDNYAQYYNGPIAGVQRGNVADSWTQDYWTEHYKWLNALNTIINLYSADDSKVNTVATAKVWRTFLVHRATDLFGDIPYSQAANGTGDLPVYDKQEDIYKSILGDLKDAVAEFDASKPTVGGNDFIYGGNIDSWKRFANTLRLRLAMRISKADAALAKTHAEEAVAGGVIETLDQEPRMVNVETPWGQGYSTKYYYDWGPGNGVGMTTTMYNMLVGFGTDFPDTTYFNVSVLNNVPAKADPRATHFFWITDQNGPDAGFEGNWTAVDNGLSVEDATDAKTFVKNNSRVSPEIHSDITRPLIIMPVSESWFLRAEGALNGWNMGVSAQVAYESGIQTSFERWGESAEYSAYVSSTNENLNGVSVAWGNSAGGDDTQLNKIITQKYIAGFPDNGWEAWADQRRLDHKLIQAPLAPDAGTTLNAGSYIQRIKYPSVAPSVNGSNYDDAVSRQGADVVSTPVWWAK